MSLNSEALKRIPKPFQFCQPSGGLSAAPLFRPSVSDGRHDSTSSFRAAASFTLPPAAIAAASTSSDFSVCAGSLKFTNGSNCVQVQSRPGVILHWLQAFSVHMPQPGEQASHLEEQAGHLEEQAPGHLDRTCARVAARPHWLARDRRDHAHGCRPLFVREHDVRALARREGARRAVSEAHGAIVRLNAGEVPAEPVLGSE